MSIICDNCRWCKARGCNDHEDHTGRYVPPPRLAATTDEPGLRALRAERETNWHTHPTCPECADMVLRLRAATPTPDDRDREALMHALRQPGCDCTGDLRAFDDIHTAHVLDAYDKLAVKAARREVSAAHEE